jgi:hypothetical protein
MKNIIRAHAIWIASVLILLFAPTTGEAQKALVYCPAVDQSGCTTVKAALTTAFPGGVDIADDGANGTIDLRTADLFQYAVFFVPSLAETDSATPYARLREPVVANRLKEALLGGRAFWSGTPDQGALADTRPLKDQLIRNLAAWASGNFATVNAPGLVVLQDNSDLVTNRYSWVQAITGFQIVADSKLASYSAVTSLTAAGNAVLNASGTTLAYSNMASFGFQAPSGGAGLSMDAVGKTGTSVGGQVVLITQSGANTGGAVVTTDKDDYAPGTPVIVTGSGFGANESVALVFHEDPTLEPDFTHTATTDANGAFTYSGFSPDTFDVDVRFILKATGQTSGRTAQTTFTDGKPNKVTVGSPGAGPFLAGGTATYPLTIEFNGTFNSTSPSCTATLSATSTGSGWVGVTSSTFTFPSNSVTANSSSDVISTSVTVNVPSGMTPGSYTFSVTATANTSCGQTGSASGTGTLVVSAPSATPATFVISNTAQTYNAAPKPVTVTPTPANATFTVTYTGTGGTVYAQSTTAPTAAGLYTVDVTAGTGFSGGQTGALTIAKATASVTPNAVSKPYGAVDPSLTGILTGFVPADNVTATYSRTAGETVAGGPYTISATLAPAGVLANYNITFNTASFTITKATASVTPAAATKNYGAVDPAFTGTLTGFAASDNVTATYSRTAGETVAGGPYTISATLAPAGVLGNYDITYNTAAFTITKATASVSPAAASKTYGAADPTLTGTLTGFKAADNVTATYSRTAGETVAGGPYTISAILAPAGVLGNYDITYNTAQFTITKATASVTPTAATKSYGAADPAFTGTLTGFAAADNVTATYSRTGGETVAGSPYTISATLAPTGVLDNYSITYNTASFTITKALASVTPNAASKTYGAADPALTGTTSGFVAADGVTATYSRVAGETVAGGPYTISATLTPAAALANYDITYNTAAFSIEKATASVTPAAANKTYGTADPTLSGTLTGFLAADAVVATYNRAPGETVAGGPYAISATLAPAGVLGNYNITYNTASFTIDKANASVTPAAASKTYGAADPALAGTLSGFAAADNVTASYTRTAGETVAGSPYSISATLAPAAVLGNYNVTYNTAAFTINKAVASVTPAAASKVYGEADPALGGSLTGFLAADNVTAAYARVPGETVAASPYTISATLTPGAVLGNYEITYNTAAFTINKKAASVTPNAASKTYGTADPALTGTLTGFLAADGVSASYTRAPGETVAGGPYAITAVLSPAAVLGNYEITYNSATFTINKALASVSPAAASKVYGENEPSLTGSLSGFLAADNVTATFTRVAGETVAGSPYTISASLAPAGVLGNYDITYNTAQFTITRKAASVSPALASKIYGEPDPAFSGSLSGFLAGDYVTAAYGRTAGETVAGSPYKISATLSPVGVLGNYDITYNTADFTINKKIASVTPNAASKTYGTTDPALSGTLTGFLAADAVSASYTRAAGETVAGGPYAISATLAPAGVLGNYEITYNTANFTIDRANASVTPAAASKTYGTADPALTGTLSGFLAADNVTASYTRTVGETVAGSPYTISATLAPAGVLGNYNVTYNTAAFTINKALASVTPAAASKTYGAADPALAGTTSGFVAADGVTASYSRTAGETVAGSPYTISAVLSPAAVLGNYDITYNTAAFTINKAPLTITAANKSRTYGDANPELTGTIVGLQFDDGITASYSTIAVPGSPVGMYAIVPAAVDCTPSKLGNYDLTLTNGTLTVTTRTLTITANSRTKTYGEVVTFAGNEFSSGSGELVNGDAVTSVTLASAGAPAAATVPGSPYDIIASGAVGNGLSNYSITYQKGVLTVIKATIVAPALSDLVKPYANATQKPIVTTIPSNVAVTLTFYQNNIPVGTPDGVSAVGVYRVEAAITDPNYTGPIGNAYFVIYDPSGGFVTGGGWINSPIGACKLASCTDGTTGKANFGFVSKYQSGANKSVTLTGNTEFQFQAGNLNFKSTAYEWLTVSGARAQYKGSGTINGGGNYQFMLTAIDGSLPGGNNQDRFRIKITDASGAVVYDNQMNTTDDAGLTTNATLLGGGSVNIHK